MRDNILRKVGLCECHGLLFDLSICTQSGHFVGLSRIGFRIGGPIDRLHPQLPELQPKGFQSEKWITNCARRTDRMAITEETGLTPTVLEARRHCLEMLTFLVESPVDYLESLLSTADELRIVPYIIAHDDICYPEN
jgi:hypothetical protein